MSDIIIMNYENKTTKQLITMAKTRIKAENSNALDLVEMAISCKNKGMKYGEFCQQIDYSQAALSQMVKVYEFIYESKRMDLVETYGFKYRNVYNCIKGGVFLDDIEKMFTASQNEISEAIKAKDNAPKDKVITKTVVIDGKEYAIPLTVLAKYLVKKA